MRYFTLLLLMPLAACGSLHDEDATASIPPSGSGSTRAYAASDFSAVQLRGPDDVDVRVGSSFSVRAEGDPKVLDHLRIVRDGDALRVGRKQSWLSWGSDTRAKVYITMPRIARAGLSGSGNMTVDRVEGAAFDGKLSGSGDITIGAVAVDNASFSIAGSGDIAATHGTARQIKVSIAGSGNFEGKNLSASSATVDVAGSGNVSAAVDGAAKVSIAGSGDVDLGPKAKCSSRTAGSGSVRCGG